MKRYLKVRVYEKQWGGFTADYVRYFDNYSQVAQFALETGFNTKIIGEVVI